MLIGWWFVSDEEGEKGWVPGVYLAKQDGKSENLVTKQAELGQGKMCKRFFSRLSHCKTPETFARGQKVV